MFPSVLLIFSIESGLPNCKSTQTCDNYVLHEILIDYRQEKK